MNVIVIIYLNCFYNQKKIHRGLEIALWIFGKKASTTFRKEINTDIKDPSLIILNLNLNLQDVKLKF